MTDDDEHEKPIPSYFHEGREVFACPCGSLRIAYKPHECCFCMVCSKRGPQSTSQEGAIEVWNRYVKLAYWRPRAVKARTEADA